MNCKAIEFSDLWIDYVQLQSEHPNGKPEMIGQIHWRAMKALDGENIQDFTNKYTLIQTGHL